MVLNRLTEFGKTLLVSLGYKERIIAKAAVAAWREINAPLTSGFKQLRLDFKLIGVARGRSRFQVVGRSPA